MKSEKIKKYIKEVISGIVVSFVLSIIFPLPGWLAVNYISSLSGRLGLVIDLIGEPATIDPGAVMVSILYIIVLLLISFILFKKSKFRIFVVTFTVTGMLFTFNVFVLISSIIWF